MAIVGAGPAGIAAALTLRKSGYDVVVVDKATFPRDKCCGDGLTTGALRVLEELEFDPNTVPSWTVCEDVRLRSPGGREMYMPLPHGAGQFAAITPRIELDNALVEQAKRAGVSVLEGHAFVAIDNSSVVERNLDRITIVAGGLWFALVVALSLVLK